MSKLNLLRSYYFQGLVRRLFNAFAVASIQLAAIYLPLEKTKNKSQNKWKVKIRRIESRRGVRFYREKGKAKYASTMYGFCKIGQSNSSLSTVSPLITALICLRSIYNSQFDEIPSAGKNSHVSVIVGVVLVVTVVYYECERECEGVYISNHFSPPLPCLRPFTHSQKPS